MLILVAALQIAATLPVPDLTSEAEPLIVKTQANPVDVGDKLMEVL